MTWEHVLPILTLVLGYAGSQFSDRLRERHERERIVVQRAADVEGEALIGLQDLLIDLPHEWAAILNRVDEYDREFGRGNINEDLAYEAVVKIGRPWQRAKLLASRIMDDALRTNVEATIQLAYPFHFREVSRMVGGLPHSYAAWRWSGVCACEKSAISEKGVGGLFRLIRFFRMSGDAALAAAGVFVGGHDQAPAL